MSVHVQCRAMAGLEISSTVHVCVGGAIHVIFVMRMRIMTSLLQHDNVGNIKGLNYIIMVIARLVQPVMHAYDHPQIAQVVQWSRKQSRIAGATDTNCGCGFDYWILWPQLFFCRGHNNQTVTKKVWYMMKIGRKHAQGFCIKPDYWRGQVPPS